MRRWALLVLCIWALVLAVGCGEDVASVEKEATPTVQSEDGVTVVPTGTQGATTVPTVGATVMPDGDKEDVSTGKGTEWDDSVATSFAGGDGSVSNPFLIENVAQLSYLSKCCDEGITFHGMYLRLECDLNLNGMEWYPIGQHTLGGESVRNTKAFRGTFDGNGHVISNYKIYNNVAHDENYDIDVGLFGYVNGAHIYDLTVKDISYYDYGIYPCVGGLIGYAEDTIVENCHVRNAYIDVVATDIYAGGLIGYIDGFEPDNNIGYVLNCSAEITMTVECTNRINLRDGTIQQSQKSSYVIGGLIGEAEELLGITNCFSTGSVSGEITDAFDITGALAGGLVGYNNDVKVYSCYSKVVVRTYDTEVEDEGSVGGLIGLAGGEIEQCYSAGKIECLSPGFRCGGLVGATYDLITNCFSATDIYAQGKDIVCDSLVGRIESTNKDRITNCYVSQETNVDYAGSVKVWREEVVVVSEENLKSKDSLICSIGFKEYNEHNNQNPIECSGWIFSKATLPKLFYEKEEESVNTGRDYTLYLGGKVKYVLSDLGSNYMSSGGLIYSDLDVMFLIDGYIDALSGEEKVLCIVFRGDQSIGNGLNADMTYRELQSIFGEEVGQPVFVEMDETYYTSISINGMTYGFEWSSSDFYDRACSCVYVSKDN